MIGYIKNFIKNYTVIFYFLIFVFIGILVGLFFLTEKEFTFGHTIVMATIAIFYFVFVILTRYFFLKIRKSEQEAILNEEKYRELIENTPLCIKVFDSKRNLVFLNKGGREEHFLEGKSEEEIKNWKWWETIKPQYRAEAMEKFQNAFEKGEEGYIEFEHAAEGSTHEWCSSLISPVKDKDGKVKSVLFISNDITSLKKAEARARENEQMFRILLDNVPLCIKWFDNEGNLISVNKAGREEHFLEAKSEEEIKKWDYLSCIDKEYQEIVKEKMKLALLGEASDFEIKHAPKTSRGLWCSSNLVLIKDQAGEVSTILLLSRNITHEKEEQKKEEEYVEKINETKTALYNILEDVKESEIKLKEEHDRLKVIISTMGEGLLFLDKNSKIVLINQMAAAMMRVAPLEAEGKNLADVFKLLKESKEAFALDKVIEKIFIEGGNVVSFGLEDKIFCQDAIGRVFPVSLIISPFFGDGITGAVIIFRDIIKEKALDDAKNSFISVASHQLRTPLTSIRWYAEMLDSGDVGDLNKEQKEFVGRVYSGALKLNETINLLLALARVESEKTEMELGKVNLLSFTEDILKELEPIIKQKDLKIGISADKKLPEIVFDPSLLRQVVTNLLSNSIRYTNKGGRIEISAKPENGGIVYSVKDNGIGIPEKQKDKIFTKFFRGTNALAMVPDGSGLGLSLVKALVEFWGGKIWFESKEGQGTIFYFTIPPTNSNSMLAT